MRENCQCDFCKNLVNEYVCIRCIHNFNECESGPKIDGITLCPKCHPPDLSHYGMGERIWVTREEMEKRFSK